MDLQYYNSNKLARERERERERERPQNPRRERSADLFLHEGCMRCWLVASRAFHPTLPVEVRFRGNDPPPQDLWDLGHEYKILQVSL